MKVSALFRQNIFAGGKKKRATRKETRLVKYLFEILLLNKMV